VFNQFYQDVELPETAKRSARKASLQYVLKGAVALSPSVEQARPVGVYAVYAQETDPPEGEEVGWMLLQLNQ